MKQLILHIGTYRTGTTSLQAFFEMNRAKLLEQGLYYPKIIDSKGYIEFFENGNMWPLHSPVKHYEDCAVQSLAEMFQHYDHILISGEDFWGSNRKEIKLKKLCSSLFDVDIKIIVYLKRQDKYLESLYNQWIKMGAKHYQYGNWRNNYEEWFHADYHDEISKMEKVIGMDHIVLRPMEKGELKDGSVIPDFCDVIGVKLDDSFQIPPEKNPSLNSSCLRVRNICNIVTVNEIKPWFSSLGSNLTAAFRETNDEMSKEGMEVDRRFLLSPPERKEIIEEFEPGNTLLANRYFARSNLFDPTIENTEITKKDNTCVTVEDFEVLIRVLSKLYLANEKRIANLCHRVAILEKNLHLD